MAVKILVATTLPDFTSIWLALTNVPVALIVELSSISASPPPSVTPTPPLNTVEWSLISTSSRPMIT